MQRHDWKGLHDVKTTNQPTQFANLLIVYGRVLIDCVQQIFFYEKWQIESFVCSLQIQKSPPNSFSSEGNSAIYAALICISTRRPGLKNTPRRTLSIIKYQTYETALKNSIWTTLINRNKVSLQSVRPLTIRRLYTARLPARAPRSDRWLSPIMVSGKIN